MKFYIKKGWLSIKEISFEGDENELYAFEEFLREHDVYIPHYDDDEEWRT